MYIYKLVKCYDAQLVPKLDRSFIVLCRHLDASISPRVAITVQGIAPSTFVYLSLIKA